MEIWTPILVALVTSLSAILASSGVWAYISAKGNKRSATTKLLLGLAHDRIIYLGMSYIDRGWITKDEYDDLINYLYDPYSHFGGNGLADKVVSEVKKLPIRKARNIVKDVLHETEFPGR